MGVRSPERGGSSLLPEEEDFDGHVSWGLLVGAAWAVEQKQWSILLMGLFWPQAACGVKPVCPHLPCGFDRVLTSLPQFPHLEYRDDIKTHQIGLFED